MKGYRMRVDAEEVRVWEGLEGGTEDADWDEDDDAESGRDGGDWSDEGCEGDARG